MGFIFVKNNFTLLLKKQGVFLLCRPSFVFPKFQTEMKSDNENFFKLNSSSSGSFYKSQRSPLDTILGVSFAVSSAFIWSIVIILIRKMNIKGIHYSLSIIYSTYFAIPITLTGSLIHFYVLNTKRNNFFFENTSTIICQILYAVIAAVSGILQIIFQIIKYKEAQKVAIIVSTDLVFGFILQYCFLNITSDIYGIIGSLLIIGSTLLITFNKLYLFNKTKIELPSNFEF